MSTKSNTSKKTISSNSTNDIVVVDNNSNENESKWFFDDKFKEEGYYVYDNNHLLKCGKQLILANDIFKVNTIDWEHPIVEFNSDIVDFECEPCTLYLIRCTHFGAYKKFKSLKWLSIVDTCNKVNVDLYDASVEIGIYYSDNEINDSKDIQEYISFKNWALLINTLKLSNCVVEDDDVKATTVWTPLENDEFVGDYYLNSIEPYECLGIICNRNNTEITIDGKLFTGEIEK